MAQMRSGIALAGLLGLAGCVVPEAGLSPTIQALDVPLEVKLFIDRRVGCIHFDSEKAPDNDPGRVRMIEDSIRRLRCDYLERDERRLRARYATTPGVIEAIERYSDASPSDIN